MIIRTISKQHIGGVTEKKDQPEWITDGRSARNLLKHLDNNQLAGLMCVSSVPFSLRTHQFGWKCLPRNR